MLCLAWALSQLPGQPFSLATSAESSDISLPRLDGARMMVSTRSMDLRAPYSVIITASPIKHRVNFRPCAWASTPILFNAPIISFFLIECFLRIIDMLLVVGFYALQLKL